MSERTPIRRALLSVYDKTRLVELGQALAEAGVELVSTGSTAGTLTKAGVQVTPIEEVTGFPECFDGRVKTLHPAVHGGILADRRLQAHRDQLDELEIAPFDLVVSNLYPFSSTVASGADFDACVEQIDIGGPAMVRAAAKNHPSVAIITSPGQYGQIVTALGEGGFSHADRIGLAAVAFAHTASYDVAVANWMAEQASAVDRSDDGGFRGRTFQQVGTLRYGENSHQQAAVYRDLTTSGGLPTAVQLHGKQMSYNNYVDADAARRAANDFDAPAIAIIKHANPCGIAVADEVATAHRKAHACDPVSAFGGVIASNRAVSVELAEQVAEIFTEVIVAPSYQPGALQILQQKKNIRILQCEGAPQSDTETRDIDGGLLVQLRDQLDAPGDDPANWTLVSGQPGDDALLDDLLFAWRAVRAVKSNAILLAHDRASVGVGMGQVNRVDSCQLAVQRAGERAGGSVAASDAFFPFSDGPQILIDAGVRAIVQPGGSVRDEETIRAAETAGVTMYVTGTRHFFH